MMPKKWSKNAKVENKSLDCTRATGFLGRTGDEHLLFFLSRRINESSKMNLKKSLWFLFVFGVGD